MDRTQHRRDFLSVGDQIASTRPSTVEQVAAARAFVLAHATEDADALLAMLGIGGES